MNDIASIRNMRPFEPAGSGGAVTAAAAAPLLTAATGLAALETVPDFAIFFVEGKRKF